MPVGAPKMATPWWRWARRCPASITSLLVSLRSLLRVQHCLLLGVVVAATASWWCSFELRFDLNVPHQYAVQRLFLLPYVVLFKLGLFYLLGGYYANWRYFGLRDVPRLILHSAVSSGIIFLLATSIERLRIPRGVILIDFFMGVVLIGGVHVSMRLLVERLLVLFRRDQRTVTKQVVVIGAGDAGEMLVRDILRTPSYGFQIRALFDDDPRKQGLNIHGIPVVGGGGRRSAVRFGESDGSCDHRNSFSHEDPNATNSRDTQKLSDSCQDTTGRY